MSQAPAVDRPFPKKRLERLERLERLKQLSPEDE